MRLNDLESVFCVFAQCLDDIKASIKQQSLGECGAICGEEQVQLLLIWLLLSTCIS